MYTRRRQVDRLTLLREVRPVPRRSKLREPVKDEDAAHPIASAWRPTLAKIVKAFVRGDYALAAGIECRP